MKYVLSQRNLKNRKVQNFIALAISVMCALLGLGLLLVILFDVLRHGISSINLELFIKDPAPPTLAEQGGLRSAFLGQGLLTLVASLIGVPLGVLAGTFLAEYGRNHKYSKVISNLADMAISVPSIVTGIFIYAILVAPFKGFNGWAGSVALAIIILPVIVRTTEEMMSLVPWNLREAAFALGAPYYKVIISIVWRAAASGIFTGVLLAIARVAGETAPLLFTSFNSNFFILSLNEPVPSLTVTIYQYAASPYESWITLAWAAAFVVTIMVLFLNILGRVIIRHKVQG
ncbi:MAG: phosphate ABC transporter permease PstA [Deltaproteobacteria bacterium]|jgi:phosphate transport system permease protein|nr:phosphate ABC transporter permease PstA [Deltaproteobacteria bacterium]